MRITLIKESTEIIEQEFTSTQVIIGRSNKCDIMVPDESLSNQHCLVEAENDELYITDLGSATGVFLDGNRLPANERTLYNRHHNLTIGIFACTIQDSLDAQNIPRSRPTKKFTPTKEKQNTHVALMIIPVLLLGVLAYYYDPEEKPAEETIIIEKAPEPAPDYKNNVQLLKEMPNDFKPYVDYLQESILKNCTGEFKKVCSQMKLNANYEGLYRKGNNLTIYLIPLLYENELRYRAISNPSEKLELIALDKVLGSTPMNEYFLDQKLHLHIALINAVAS